MTRLNNWSGPEKERRKNRLWSGSGWEVNTHCPASPTEWDPETCREWNSNVKTLDKINNGRQVGEEEQISKYHWANGVFTVFIFPPESWGFHSTHAKTQSGHQGLGRALRAALLFWLKEKERDSLTLRSTREELSFIFLPPFSSTSACKQSFGSTNRDS